MGTIKQSDLPADLQKMFHYNPDLADAAAKQKAETQEELEAIEAQKAAVQDQKHKAELTQEQAEDIKKDQLEKQIAALKDKIKQESNLIESAKNQFRDLTVELAQGPSLSRAIDINMARKADYDIFNSASPTIVQLRLDRAALAQLEATTGSQ
jgi:predicted  nucleic acid-binding Zn-ribbon protein